MGDGTRTYRVVDSFSSCTGQHAHPTSNRRSEHIAALRAKLIDATVAVVAEGSVLRLDESRALP